MAAKHKKIRVAWLVLLWFGTVPLYGATAVDLEKPITIPEALRLAEEHSPDLKAALHREDVYKGNLSILKSVYYPTVDAEAVDSYGFPGSTSSSLGIGGVMGSPFRSGPAAGLTSNLTLFDGGRGYSVQQARDEVRAIQERTKVTRFDVDQSVLAVYLEASRFRGQRDAYQEVARNIMEVAHEVEKFVRTGQRSVVDRLLVEDQITDAQMTAAAFQERYQVALERVALATGRPIDQLSCPTPALLTEESLGMSRASPGSPLVTQAAAEAEAAHAGVSLYQAQHLPKLRATASVGDVDEARLVNKRYYAGGFGVDLPLFEGGRISGEVHQAQALAAQRDEDVNAVRFQLEELNAHFDETINASRVQLNYLDNELEMAQSAFNLAKHRYFAFQGTLVDVREALRNLERIQGELIDVKTDLLLAVGSKALLNGGHSGQ